MESTAPIRIAIGQRLPAAPAGVHGALPSGLRHEYWQALMTHAADPDAVEIQAMAGVLAAAFEARGTAVLPLAGLSAGSTRRMFTRWFPGADTALDLHWAQLADAPRSEERYDEIEDVVTLLVDAAEGAGKAEDALWIAHALAQACLGDDHLWQDLHLPSRRELSALIQRWYPQLAARNDRNMKWKKFLYKQLCDKAGLYVCRAPSCGVCSDYAVCFGPEDAAAA